MIHTLRLSGYRSFDDYEVSGLGRVNLFVGENGSGKTSLLEAVELLASSGGPAVFRRAAARRGELRWVADPESGEGRWMADPAQFFPGHEIRPEETPCLRIEGEPEPGAISLRVRALTAAERRRIDASAGDSLVVLPEFALEFTGGDSQSSALVPLDSDGQALGPVLHGGPATSERETMPVAFLASDPLDADRLREMWDQVLVEGRESEVVEALRVVEERLASLHFLIGVAVGSRPGVAGILAGLDGERRRIPLGSLGGGITRALALALSVITSTGGCVLVDELAGSAHWSVMQETWRFLIRTAARSSVQIMATTHSFDCLEALASLCRDSPDLVSEVFVFKLDRRLRFAVRFDADQVDAGLGMNIELR